MSLIVTVYVPMGIVLSGDSRTTATFPNSTKTIFSDSARKVLHLFNKYGVGACGEAHIKHLPISHYVEEYENNNLDNPPSTTQDLAAGLLNYFVQGFNPLPNIKLLVIGYDGKDPKVVSVDVSAGLIQQQNYDEKSGQISYGIGWEGDISVVSRLLGDSNYCPLFHLLDIQDAVDFSRHLIRTTSEQMRFEPHFPTVGGPIDSLVVTPRETKYFTKKEFHFK
jgi:hypothetical protein